MQNLQPASTAGGTPPTLDLGFLTPGSLPAGLTFTRTTTATYFDSAGVMQTAAANAPRWDYDPITLVLRGLLIEDQRTNLFLNSATLVTQNVTVTAQVYTLSFYGTGTITYSGVASGSLAGAGAFPQRAFVSFTPTAGTLTCTVTGSVLNAQIEAGGAPSSWITTAGATASRAGDFCSTATGAWFNPSASSVAIDYMLRQSSNPTAFTRHALVISDGSFVNRLNLIGQNTVTATALTAIASTPTSTPALGNVTANAVMKLAAAWGGGSMMGCLNGGTVAPVAVGMPAGLSEMAIGVVYPGSGPGSALHGHIRRVRYWPLALAPADLQAVTA